MTRKNNNWLNYLLVFALMLLPLQNGMAAISVASMPDELKQVCPEMVEHAQHQVTDAEQMDMQKHNGNCCDNDKNCQQSCNDSVHCSSVTAIINNTMFANVQGYAQLFSSAIIYPDTLSLSSHLRPPRV